jgi:hypothetical protein
MADPFEKLVTFQNIAGLVLSVFAVVSFYKIYGDLRCFEQGMVIGFLITIFILSICYLIGSGWPYLKRAKNFLDAESKKKRR